GMKIYNYSSVSAEKRISAIVNRGLAFKKKDFLEITRILEEIRRYGDKALIKYVNLFDAPDMGMESLKVTQEEMDTALERVEQSFLNALNRAADQIESFHRQQL